MMEARPDRLDVPPMTAIQSTPGKGRSVAKLSEPVQWETLAAAAKRTGYAYQTFKKWKSQRRLPFAVYVNSLVKSQEVDAWVESTRTAPCRPDVEKVRL